MLRLGFLKFLQRNKGKEDLGLEYMEGLDVPPPPPDIGKGGFPESQEDFCDMPELPELPQDDNIFSEEDKAKGPELKFPGFPKMPEAQKRAEMRDFPAYPRPMAPKIEAAEPEITPRPLFGMQRPQIFSGQMPYEQKSEAPMPSYQGMTPYQRLEKAAVREERSILKHKEAKAPVFIRVERFRNVLNSSKDIRNDLKIADQSIARLTEIDANKDKVFERWHNTMTDLQKKIIFIDKALFKKQSG